MKVNGACKVVTLKWTTPCPFKGYYSSSKKRRKKIVKTVRDKFPLSTFRPFVRYVDNKIYRTIPSVIVVVEKTIFGDFRLPVWEWPTLLNRYPVLHLHDEGRWAKCLRMEPPRGIATDELGPLLSRLREAPDPRNIPENAGFHQYK